MKVTVLSGQSLVDIAIQVYGSAEGVFLLALENGLSVTDELEPGQTLIYSSDNVIRADVVQYLRAKRVTPATGEVIELGIFDNIFDLTFY